MRRKRLILGAVVGVFEGRLPAVLDERASGASWEIQHRFSKEEQEIFLLFLALVFG